MTRSDQRAKDAISVSATEEVLRQTLASSLGLSIDCGQLAGAGLLNQIGIDSVQCIVFLIAVEERFGIHVDDDDLSLELIDDLSVLAAYVDARRLRGPAR